MSNGDMPCYWLGMRSHWILLFALVLFGCKPQDRSTPEGAFSRLSKCIDAIDARCLFAELDRESRWSLETIHTLLRQTREAVEASYPPEARLSALGAWAEEAEAKDAAGMFEVFCGKRRCMEVMARGFGAVVKVEKKDRSSAEIETTRGERFLMAEADGEWGLASFAEELQKAKLRSYDRLKQVKLNAAEYEQQRLASGSVKSDSDERR